MLFVGSTLEHASPSDQVEHKSDFMGYIPPNKTIQYSFLVAEDEHSF